MVDIGSNRDEFWFWFGKSPEPYQFYCSYKDYEEGRVRRLPFPFQPEWILEALGMGPYSSADKIVVDGDAKTIRLVEKTRSPQGQPIRKVIVLSRRPVQPPAPQVQSFLLIDDTTQKEICSAQILEVQLAPNGALVPKKMELRWPAESAKLTLSFHAMQINPRLDVNDFRRQPLQGVQSVDLAQIPGGGIQRTRGSAP
jgi:hypothetical protein